MILIFALPVVLLGMVSPWVIRLRVDAVSGAGRAAGTVYAISTAGSILGAFLPAFWWIPISPAGAWRAIASVTVAPWSPPCATYRV